VVSTCPHSKSSFLSWLIKLSFTPTHPEAFIIKQPEALEIRTNFYYWKQKRKSSFQPHFLIAMLIRPLLSTNYFQCVIPILDFSFIGTLNLDTFTYLFFQRQTNRNEAFNMSKRFSGSEIQLWCSTYYGPDHSSIRLGCVYGTFGPKGRFPAPRSLVQWRLRSNQNNKIRDFVFLTKQTLIFNKACPKRFDLWPSWWPFALELPKHMYKRKALNIFSFWYSLSLVTKETSVKKMLHIKISHLLHLYSICAQVIKYKTNSVHCHV